MDTGKRKAPKLDKNQVVSAQVVLRAASGKSIRSQEPITAHNIQDYLPSREAVSTATKMFAGAGFEVGAMVANSFSLTAPVAVFEPVFKTHLRLEGGTVKAVRSPGDIGLELPLSALDHTLATYIEAVTFSPPLDFGPTNW
ncbi:MAG: hypothetical protein FJ147_22205 [Deltaproteobacteria bacterium]|nr:hypothetical protein [Deltaproteobacteria bacterium]